jgi:hypothetical protein
MEAIVWALEIENASDITPAKRNFLFIDIDLKL